MKATYDPSADAAYVYLRPPPRVAVARSDVLEDGRIVDFDETGELLGIEILGVSRAGIHLLDLVERFGLDELRDELERLEHLPPEQIAAG